MKRHGYRHTFSGVPSRLSDSRYITKRIGRHRRPIRICEFLGTFDDFKAASLAPDAKYKIFLFSQMTFDFVAAQKDDHMFRASRLRLRYVPPSPDNHIDVPDQAFHDDPDTVIKYFNPPGTYGGRELTWTAKNTDLLETCVSNVHDVLEKDDAIDEVLFYKPDLLWDEEETSAETFNFFLSRLEWFNVDYRRKHVRG